MNQEKYFSANYGKYELTYYLLKSGYEKIYGVGITSCAGSEMKSSFCYNLSENKEEMIAFLEMLCRTTTFPTTLNDMIEDWMFEKVAL